jgi:type VI protein secretion system component VasK
MPAKEVGPLGMSKAPRPACLREHERHGLFDAACETAAVKNPGQVLLERSTGVFANAQQHAQRLRGAYLLRRYNAQRTGY